MKIYLASDHAGFELKENLRLKLQEAKYNIHDLGPVDHSPTDYPDWADKLVSVLLPELPGARGILVCGTGIGMSIRASRYHGVRAASIWSKEASRLSREHNDLNVLCLGARLISKEEAWSFSQIFLKTEFLGERHARRVAGIEAPLRPIQ